MPLLIWAAVALAAPTWVGDPVDVRPAGPHAVAAGERVRVLVPVDGLARPMRARALQRAADALWGPLGDVLGRYPRERLDVVLVPGTGPAVVDVAGDRLVLPMDDGLGPDGDPVVRLARGLAAWIAVKRVAGPSEVMLDGIRGVGVADGRRGGIGGSLPIGGGPPGWWVDAVGEAAARAIGWGAPDPAGVHRARMRSWPAWHEVRGWPQGTGVGAAAAAAFGLDLDALLALGDATAGRLGAGWHRALVAHLDGRPAAIWSDWADATATVLRAGDDTVAPPGPAPVSPLDVHIGPLWTTVRNGDRDVFAVADGAIGRPTVSPDGSAFVVAVRAAGRQDLWSASMDGGPPLRLTDDAHLPSSPVWTDAGIWFVAAPDGTADVYLRHADGHVTRHTHGFGAMSITLDGFVVGPNRSLAPIPATGEPVHGVFRTTPSTDTRELEHRCPAPGALDRTRGSVGAPVVAPVVRLDGDADGLHARLGAEVIAAGVLRRRALRLDGLVGEDAALGAAYGVALGQVRITATGGGALDRRGLLLGDGVRRGVRTAAVRLDGGERVPWRVWGGTARLLLAGVPAGDTRRGGVGGTVVVGRTLTADLDLVGAWSAWADRAGPWGRATGRLELALPGPGQIRLGAEGGWTSTDVHPEEELRLGGDHPLALRQAMLERSIPLLGWAPWALSGDAVAVGRVDTAWPIARGGGAIGPWSSDGAAFTIGADLATVVPRPETLGTLFDARIGVQVDGDLGGRPLDASVVLALPTTTPMAPRVYVVVGGSR